MPESQIIEIPSHKIRDLFLFARLQWCKFTISDQKDFQESLRFIECERKLDNLTSIHEVILEADLDQAAMEVVNNMVGQQFLINFEVDGDEYQFEAKLKDLFILFEKIPVISLEWPKTVFKKKLRLSERITNLLPEEFEENKIYILDISINGMGLICSNSKRIQIGQEYEVLLTIPGINKAEGQLSVQSTQYKTKIEAVRYSLYKGKHNLFGCRFVNFDPRGFFLIRKYLNIRKKEEKFFQDNQYYPDLVLPQIEISQQSFPAN